MKRYTIKVGNYFHVNGAVFKILEILPCETLPETVKVMVYIYPSFDKKNKLKLGEIKYLRADALDSFAYKVRVNEPLPNRREK